MPSTSSNQQSLFFYKWLPDGHRAVSGPVCLGSYSPWLSYLRNGRQVNVTWLVVIFLQNLNKKTFNDRSEVFFVFSQKTLIPPDFLPPSCWDPSPPEGDSKLGRGHSSCGYPLSRWLSKSTGGNLSAEKQKQWIIIWSPVLPDTEENENIPSMWMCCEHVQHIHSKH